MKLPTDWNTWDLNRRRAYIKNPDPLDETGVEIRTKVCAAEFLCEMMGINISDKVNKEEKPKKEKKNIDKTNGKKIIEKEINDLEKKVNLLNNELLKSEVYMDQLKSKDILLQIESLNKLIDKKYIDLESIEDCGN